MKISRFFCLLALLFAGFFPVSSFAIVPTVQGFFDSCNGTVVHGLTTERVGAQCITIYADYFSSSYPGCSYTNNYTATGWSSGYLTSCGGNYQNHPDIGRETVCPANSTLQGGSCVCTPPTVEDSTHTSCIDPPTNACQSQAGVVSTHNVTAGYSRSVAGAGLYPPIMPNGSAAAAGYNGLPPSMMCILGCNRTRGAIVASWTSLEPTATGLYRQSDDWSFTGLASECTATPDDKAALDSTSSVPPCVGFLGQVNGKTACVAAAGAAIEPTSTKPVISNVGNPTAGTSGGAANIPSTGGNGGNAGGPKGSNDGSAVVGGQIVAGAGTPAPSGTVATPVPGEEQTACGAPGQPRCAIDEAGTPPAVGDDVYGPKLNGVKAEAGAALGTMGGSGDKPFFGGWSVLFSAPPVAACSPISLPGFRGGDSMGSLDPCPVVDGMRYVMGLLWAMGGLLFSLKMVKDVV